MINLSFRDMLVALCSDLSITYNLQCYLLKRYDNEGLKFLTVTLPKLNDLVLRGLEHGSISSLKAEFSCFRWKSNAPLHFAGLLNCIFDKSGCVLDNPDVTVLYVIRQLSLYFYKLAVDFDDGVLADAEEKFVREDESLETQAYDHTFVEKMRRNLENNYSFPSYTDILSISRPRSGPGTFAGCKAIDVPYYVFKESYALETALSRHKAISGYFKTRPSAPTVNLVERDTSDTSELLFVPKDSRGPRSITREPYFNLMAQMSFFDYMSKFLEKASNRRINFSDQQVNNNLAKNGSSNGDWATLDLKSASDRVSFKLVKHLSQQIPSLRYFLQFRTKKCTLPSGKIMNLNKLSGMGSGLTFVWLALICHTAIATEISARSALSFEEAGRLVYVYGDDIVVPSTYVQHARAALGKCLLSVNDSKSFWRRHLGNRNNYFRESCGGDYFGGVDVTVIKARFSSATFVLHKNKPTFGLEGDTSINNVLAHAKELKHSGMNCLSHYYYGVLETRYGKLPLCSNYDNPCLVRYVRSYVDYPIDKCGNYRKLRILAPTPVLLDVPLIESNKRYASSLNTSVGTGNIWDYYDNSSRAIPDNEIIVPRTVVFKRRTISSLALIG